jgi:IPT/TIG domain-containing protein
MSRHDWQVLHLVLSVVLGLAGMLLFVAVAALARLSASGAIRTSKAGASRTGADTTSQTPPVLGLPVSQPRPLGLLLGTDGRLSTSKCQWFIWTLVIIGGYCAVVAARGLRGDLTADVGLPAALLTAMGFSTLTVATAKGITSTYTASFGLVKSPTTNAGGTDPMPPTMGLLTDDGGDLDLSKVQLITWTIVAVGIWVALVLSTLGYIAFADAATFDPAKAALPDIGPTLLVLTGLSQGGYLGKKLATLGSFVVRVDSLVPSTVGAMAPAPQRVTIFGLGFGDNSDGRGAVKLDGAVAHIASTWTDGRIDFDVPAGRAPGELPVTLVVSGVDQSPRALQVR